MRVDGDGKGIVNILAANKLFYRRHLLDFLYYGLLSSCMRNCRGW